jgi:hypothetical protein
VCEVERSLFDLPFIAVILVVALLALIRASCCNFWFPNLVLRASSFFIATWS